MSHSGKAQQVNISKSAAGIIEGFIHFIFSYFLIFSNCYRYFTGYLLFILRCQYTSLSASVKLKFFSSILLSDCPKLSCNWQHFQWLEQFNLQKRKLLCFRFVFFKSGKEEHNGYQSWSMLTSLRKLTSVLSVVEELHEEGIIPGGSHHALPPQKHPSQLVGVNRTWSPHWLSTHNCIDHGSGWTATAAGN